MKKILILLLAVFVIIAAFTGCSKEDYTEEIQSFIDELCVKVESLSSDADETYKNGVISEDLYTQIKALEMKFNENKNLFESEEESNNSKILKALKECKETADELQKQIDSVYEDYDEVRNYGFELLNNARILSEYMEAGLTKGYINQATMDEFTDIRSRLEQITEKQFPDESVKAELDDLKERLAVMSSQCAASNEVVDLFIDKEGDISQGNISNDTETSDLQSSNDTENPLDNDMQEVIDNFTLLQNEASQNFDKGIISEEDYMTLIKKGTKLAELKEEIEKNGVSNSTNKKLSECKKEIYDIAVKVGSSLAEKFE